MAKKQKTKQLDMSQEDLVALQERVKKKQLVDDDYRIFEEILNFSMWLSAQLQNAKTTIRKLKDMIFGEKTEKKSRSKNNLKSNDLIVPKMDTVALNQNTLTAEINVAANQDNADDPKNDLDSSNKPKSKGHGRNPATDYTPDEIIVVSHEKLKAGDYCPSDCGGRLYPIPVTAGGIIRVRGQSCGHIVSFKFNRLRCALCGETFTPPKPDIFTEEKYDERFKAIIVVQKYFLAIPFYRQESYQNMIGFPLADATQWDIAESVANDVYPILGELEKQAANYNYFNNDDTHAKILDVMRDNKLNPDKKRTGMFTTCVLASSENQPTICLYYSGVKHSGENVSHLLEKRDKILPPIIQMCDALSANVPKAFKVILCNCLAHARRNFLKIDTEIPEEAEYVVSLLGMIYHHDAQAKVIGMSPEERLAYHKKESAPIMETLKTWMKEQFNERKIEPNSGLGKAILYMQRRWEKLTRFLYVTGAHLDNNIVEQALKFVIQVRKNSMFHKSEHGAYVAGLFFSIIKTCILAGINPIEYLTTLQKNKIALFKAPHLWLPWNYISTLAEIENIPIQRVA